MYESKKLSMSWCNRFAYFNKFPSSLSGINKFSFLLKQKVVWEIKHLHVSKDDIKHLCQEWDSNPRPHTWTRTPLCPE